MYLKLYFYTRPCLYKFGELSVSQVTKLYQTYENLPILFLSSFDREKSTALFTIIMINV